ncbi:hypothetical protein Phage2-1_00068 [Achromobacter phage 2-1]|nr:hypothetical protein Phage2-1_00068 [Achromobacter phage 2-1]
MNTTFTAVESSQIAGYQYDAKSSTLRIKFIRGGVYEYQGVEPQVIEQVFVNSSSVGSAFTSTIKKNPSKYPFTKVG